MTIIVGFSISPCNSISFPSYILKLCYQSIVFPSGSDGKEIWVRSLSWENPQEKGLATHSSILAWRIPWTEEPGGLWSMGLERVGHS